MSRAAILLALTAATSTGGCALAVVPVGAAAMVAKDHSDTKKERRRRAERASPALPTLPALGGVPGQLYAGQLPPPSGPAPAPLSGPANTGTVYEPRQYLFGSGESAGLSLQAYQSLTNYLETVKYRRKETLRQVVLDEGSTLDKPYFEPCGEKPPAIVLDIDETALLNIGYESDAARRGLGFDQARWARWEATGAGDVIAVPGAKAALDSARGAGITVIFNSNRSAANAEQTVTAIDKAGLGPAVHKTTLWLKGDEGGGSGKDVRRWAITSGYCVVALVGDQLGDFSDLFNDPVLTPAARRALAQLPAFASLWGNGWFLLPNPVYGPGLKGGYDDVFPAATRWTDPGADPAPDPAEEKK